MGGHWCFYCEAHIPHDSPKGRRQHWAGRPHKQAVNAYYSRWLADATGHGQVPAPWTGVPGAPSSSLQGGEDVWTSAAVDVPLAQGGSALQQRYPSAQRQYGGYPAPLHQQHQHQHRQHPPLQHGAWGVYPAAPAHGGDPHGPEGGRAHDSREGGGYRGRYPQHPQYPQYPAVFDRGRPG